MKRVCILIAAVFSLSVAAARAKDSPGTPPAGIVPAPAGVTVGSILKAYDAATGTLAPGTADTRREVWAFDRFGLHGTETLVRKGLDYVSRIESGPLIEEYGQRSGKGWHRDYNGVVAQTDEADYESFEMQAFLHAFSDPEDPKNDVKLLGEVDSPVSAYVLAVKIPDRSHPEYLFYDRKTGLIDRIEETLDGDPWAESYDDYRTTGGLTEPWHLHFIIDNDQSRQIDFVMQSLKLGAPVAGSELAEPQSASQLDRFSGDQKLPARIVDDIAPCFVNGAVQLCGSPNVVIRLIVNGRGLDFSLSTAQPESLIDFGVAQQLGLPSYGQVTHFGRDAAPYETIIPQAQLGNVTLHDFAVDATPFNYNLTGDTKIVGLLGYDVLEGGVWKIDYVNGTLELDPAAAFNGPDPVPGAKVLPLDLDDGSPFISATLDEHLTGNVLIDNDFDFSVLFGGFTQAYPDDAKDVSNGKARQSEAIPFADSSGYGENVDIWEAQVPDVQLGFLQIQNLPIMATNEPHDQNGHQVDAVIGADLLRFYDVYLDFPHQRILLKPNASFFKAFKAVQ